MVAVVNIILQSEHVMFLALNALHVGRSSCLYENSLAPTENKKAQLSLTNPRDAKSLPKIAPIRRAYNVVADNTGLSSFV